MRTRNLLPILAVALLSANASANAQRAPRVRLLSTSGTAAGNVNASVQVDEDSFVLVVGIDRDGNVSVLAPESPRDIAFVPARKQAYLRSFFAGYGIRTPFESRYQFGNYNSYVGYHSGVTTYDEVYGTIFAIASRDALDIAAISDGEYWNTDAILQLVRYRSPWSAGQALGRAVVRKGQAFSHDELKIASSQPYYAGAEDFCEQSGRFAYYGFADYPGPLFFTNSNTPYRAVFIGRDVCGRPRYAFVQNQNTQPAPSTPAPAPKPTDSAVLYKGNRVNSGVFSGVEAQRVFEQLQRAASTHEGFTILESMPVIKDGSDGIYSTMSGRPVSRGGSETANTRSSETYERVNVERVNARPVDVAPVERPVVQRAEPAPRAEPVQQVQPVTRSEPVMRSEPTAPRTVESVPAAKDNCCEKQI